MGDIAKKPSTKIATCRMCKTEFVTRSHDFGHGFRCGACDAYASYQRHLRQADAARKRWALKKASQKRGLAREKARQERKATS